MLSALVLLLLATCMGLTSATRPLPALTDDACPPVPTALITSFVAGSVAGGATTLTRAQAAALACQLNAVLSQAGDGNSTATALLDTLYEAWRRSYTPQVWQRQPLDSSYVRRYAVWLANLRTIVDTNQRLTLKYWSGLNAYSDFTADEFAANVLMNRSPAPVPPSTTRRMLARGSTSTPSVPASVNWVTAGKVTPRVAAQYQCASSWAMATTAALESNLLINNKAATVKALSAQWLMDCTAYANNLTAASCSGGDVTAALALAAQGPVPTDATWRYRADQGGTDVQAEGFVSKCGHSLTPKQVDDGLVRITSVPAFTQVSANKLALQTALVAQPVVATITVDSATFQHYAGGIYSSQCDDSSPTQAVLVVGYDTTKAGAENWLLRNSLGASWGERGYARLAMADAACGSLYQNAYQVGTVSSVNVQVASSAAAATPTKPASGTTTSSSSKPASTTTATKPATGTAAAKPATGTTATKPASDTTSSFATATKPASDTGSGKPATSTATTASPAKGGGKN